MKKLFLTLALAASAAMAHGQGTIAFANGPTVRHQLQTAVGSSVYASVPLGAAITYGIFIGASADSLSTTPVLPLAIASATSLGQMQGIASIYVLPSDVGTVVFAQIRAWDSTFGADWNTARLQGRYWGQTDVRELEPLGPSTGPATVIWQGATAVDPNRFYAMRIDLVPEPSTIALGVLGLGSLLLFRRRTVAK
jgi:hypothetical protein